MKKIRIIFLLFQTPLFCGPTAIQNLTLGASPSSSISTSGNPGTLSVSLDTAGTGSATNSSTTYTVISNVGGKRSLTVTGMISSGGNMPSNTSLTINLASNKGTSQGTKLLSTTAINLVTNLDAFVSDTGAITYTFTVTKGWTLAAQTLSRTVTLTLTSN